MSAGPRCGSKQVGKEVMPSFQGNLERAFGLGHVLGGRVAAHARYLGDQLDAGVSV